MGGKLPGCKMPLLPPRFEKMLTNRIKKAFSKIQEARQHMTRVTCLPTLLYITLVQKEVFVSWDFAHNITNKTKGLEKCVTCL